MARIPYFDMSQAPVAYTGLLAGRPPLNLYRMLPHAGPAARACPMPRSPRSRSAPTPPP